jgi:hypothetical protein
MVDSRHVPSGSFETYPDRILLDLFTHWGQWRRLQHTVGGNAWEVRDAVVVARNLGFVVQGDRALGYRVVDWHRILNLRVAKASEWPPRGKA